MSRSRTSAQAEVLLFRAKFRSRWKRRTVGVLASVALMAAPTLVVRAVSSQRVTSGGRAAQWFLDHQRPNGAFFADDDRANATAQSLAAAVAGGASGEPVTRALGYISKSGQADATRGAYTGRIIAGIVAGGSDPTGFGGVNYVAILDSQYNPVTGAYDTGNFFSDLLGANGALAANGSLPAQAIQYIKANECVGGGGPGGFGNANACLGGPDVDTTALAVDALVAAGLAADPAVTRARTFLLSKQHDDGGFGFSGTAPTSGDSTGLALALINALGEDAEAIPWRQPDGDTPVAALLGLQHADGGFKFTAGSTASNRFSTDDATAGMAGMAFPIRATTTPASTATPAPTPTPTPAASSAPTPTATPTPTSTPTPLTTPTPNPTSSPAPAPDTTPPDTTIMSPDLTTTRDRTPTFRFTADESNATFGCSVDGGKFRPCDAPFTFPRLETGKHVFMVRAIDSSGNVDPSPPWDGFRVVSRRARR